MGLGEKLFRLPTFCCRDLILTYVSVVGLVTFRADMCYTTIRELDANSFPSFMICLFSFAGLNPALRILTCHCL